MTNTKTTKRALFASVLSLLLCISMLVGSTFAWFTDTASTSVNKIVSGNLDVQLVDKDGNSIEGDTLDFVTADGRTSNILWEPGCTYNLPDVFVKNNGNLAIKYKIVISGIQGDAKLNEAIEWTIALNGQPLAAEYTLAAGATSKALTISGHMKEEAGNEYQNLTIDGIAITVYATQATAEFDSFNNQYDKNAYYSDEAEIQKDVPAILHSPNASVTIPANTLAEGQTVKLKEQNTEPHNGVEITVDDTLIVAKDISIVDADGNEVDMPDGSYKVTMNVGKNLDASKLALYHNDKKVEPISYDATTGIVSFTTDSFSPFTVMYEGLGYINSAEDLVKVSERAAAGETREGVVYYLTKDIDLSGVEFSTIANFAGTFDGQNHTISNLTTNLFGTVSGTVKNLNVKNVTATNTAKGGANGFIGTVAEGGLVDNCKVSDVTITWPETLKDTCDCYGGIINRVNTGATVQNCEFANITMTGHGYVKRSSAVFAEVSGKISGCTVDGVTLKVITKGTIGVNGSDAYTSQVGGIIADLYSGAEVSDCSFNNVTLVIDEATNTGGIIGKAYVTGTAGPCEISLKNITVNGLTMNIGHAVEAKYSAVSNVGGFIGQMDSRNNDSHLTMDNCHINDLDMTLASKKKGEDPSGGFIASLNGGADITNCSVDGKINGTNEPIGIGGFLGTVGGHGAPATGYTINITGCAADVAITGNDNIYVGGFVAHAGSYNKTMTKLDLTFTNCEATGSFYGVKDTNETEVCTFTGCKVDGAAFNG